MSLPHETIVALATPPGAGAVGIIRLSGPRSIDIFKSVFQPSKSISTYKSHQLYYGSVVHPGTMEIFDSGLGVVFYAPHSFTGEDCVELQLHGSPLNLSRIIKLCCQSGARLAEAGEFSKRAFLNRKMDLNQVEAIADLISSQTEAEARNSLMQMGGYLSRTIKEITANLNRLLALIELNFDFSDQDYDIINNNKINSELRIIYQNIDSLIQTFKTGQLMRHGVRLVLIGKPNVGKSSLMNFLLKEDKSIIHHSSGTTRDVISGQLLLGQVILTLYDTAGVHESADEIESLGIQKSRDLLSRADLVLFLLDQSRPLDNNDEEIARELRGKNVFIIQTKCDLPSRWTNFDFLNLKVLDSIAISVFDESSRLNLISRLELIVQNSVQNSDHNYVLNNVRHYQALLDSSALLRESMDLVSSNAINDDCLVENLRRIVEYLSGITGEITSETVLDEIFSKFCIGK